MKKKTIDKNRIRFNLNERRKEFYKTKIMLENHINMYSLQQ